MNARARLFSLGRVTDVAFDVAQRDLREVLQQREHLEQEIAALEEQRLGAAGLGADHIAISSGAVESWKSWIDQRKAVVNRQLALLRVREDSAREKMRLAFGKREAMRQVIRKSS